MFSEDAGLIAKSLARLAFNYDKEIIALIRVVEAQWVKEEGIDIDFNEEDQAHPETLFLICKSRMKRESAYIPTTYKSVNHLPWFYEAIEWWGTDFSTPFVNEDEPQAQPGLSRVASFYSSVHPKDRPDLLAAIRRELQALAPNRRIQT